jgi:hypothetical protein
MSSGGATRACSRSMEENMTVEIANTEDGLGLNVRVCEDSICLVGFCSSMHLIEKKANELRAAIRKKAAETFAEIQDLEAEAMGAPGPR